MRRHFPFAFLMLLAVPTVRAESPCLRLIPSDVELVVVAPRPTRIIPGLFEHPIAKDLAKTGLLDILYESPTLQKLDQLVVYLEKRLKGTRFELLDQLTADGVVLGARLSKDAAPLVVLKAKDAELLKNTLTAIRELIDQELDRQDKKERIHKSSHKKMETFHLGKGLHFAQAGSFLIVSTDETLFQRSLDLFLEGKDKDVPPGCIVPRLPKRELGDKTLLWAWLDFESVQKNDKFKDQFNSLTKDPFIQIFVGGVLDVLKRSPHVEFTLERDGHDFRLAFAMPRGLNGMSEMAKSFVPSEGKKLLPPLAPPRVIASASWTFDIGMLWKNKKAWLGEQADMDLDKAEKEIGKYLKGIALGELLQNAGWNQRIVLAEQGVSPYKIKPRASIVPFAVVFEMRDPAFVPAIEKLGRTGGLAASIAFGMRMKEEDYKGRKLISYYFDEARKVADDMENVRFSFSPTMVHVGNSFVVSSTAELARDLVDCLEKEEKHLSAGASFRADLHAAGLAYNLESVRKEILVAAILDQGLAPGEAGKYIDSLIDLVRKSGTVHWNVHYGAEDYRLEFVWKTGRK